MAIDWTKTGYRIQELRRKRGVTQKEMASAADIQQTALSRLELGEKGMNCDTAAKIAGYLGVTLDYLLFGTGGKEA